jgi:hypothetical protein
MERVKSPHVLRVIGAVVMTVMAGVIFSWASVVTGWTTVGSAGTVDEDSMSIVRQTGPFVELRVRCLFEFLGNHSILCSPSTGTVTVRYNVVPTDAVTRHWERATRASSAQRSKPSIRQ